jgi:hypothetical protein
MPARLALIRCAVGQPGRGYAGGGSGYGGPPWWCRCPSPGVPVPVGPVTGTTGARSVGVTDGLSESVGDGLTVVGVGVGVGDGLCVVGVGVGVGVGDVADGVGDGDEDVPAPVGVGDAVGPLGDALAVGVLVGAAFEQVGVGVFG